MSIFDRPLTHRIVSGTTPRHDDDRSTLPRVCHQSVPDMRFSVLATLPGDTVLQAIAASFRRRSHTNYQDQTAATGVSLAPLTSLLGEINYTYTIPHYLRDAKFVALCLIPRLIVSAPAPKLRSRPRTLHDDQYHVVLL